MKFRIYLLFLLLVSTGVLQGCKKDKKTVIKTTAVTFTKEGELSILKAETDSLVTTLDIEIADSDYETQTGLMYRDAMENNQGMLFIFPNEAMHSFYMKNTKIPLDIIFVTSNLNIASFQENAQPLNETGLSSKVPVQYVLEVNAGLVNQWQLEVGDRITFQKN